MIIEITERKYLDKINQEIRKVVSEDILKMRPCISGGFMISCLFNSLGRNELSNFISKYLRLEYPYDYSKLFSTSKCQVYYSDVDLFFIGSNKNPFASKLEETFDFENFSDERNKALSLTTKGLGLESDYMFLRSSKFAVTLKRKSIQVSSEFGASYGIPVQFILKEYDSLEDLFGSFDIHNSCISWIDGKLYVSEKFLESFYKGEVSYNKNYKALDSITDDIYQCLRMMKYRDRFGIDFCKDAYKRLMSVYIMAEDIDVDSYSDLVTIETYYGTKISQRSSIYKMINNFVSRFGDVCLSKNFKKEDLIYFVSSKTPHIRYLVEEYLFRDNYNKNRVFCTVNF